MQIPHFPRHSGKSESLGKRTHQLHNLIASNLEFNTKRVRNKTRFFLTCIMQGSIIGIRVFYMLL